jgi:hypothetical protein
VDVATEGTGFCIHCGARLEAVHRFCWNCGAARWTPEGEAATPAAAPRAQTERAPPTPGTSVFGRPQAETVAPVTDLGLLPWFYAGGGVLFLVLATKWLAYFLSPGGQSQLTEELSRQGVAASAQGEFLAVSAVFLVGGSLVAAALHGSAFYGLRRFRRWGWIAAVVAAALWSLLIVGIPVLVLLISRGVRQAFGVD